MDAWDLVRSAALITGGLFAGVLLYTATIGHRVRLAMGPPVAHRHFLESLDRSERLQPPLHGLCLASTIAWLIHDPSAPLVLAFLTMAPILPFSLRLMGPLNRKLRDPALSPDSSETAALLERWGRLHLARATLAVAAFALLTLV